MNKDSIYNVKHKQGDVLYGCTGKRMGVFKRKKAKRFTRPGKVKVIVSGR